MSAKVPKNIRRLNRYITTHNADGKAIFSTTLSEVMPVQSMADGADFSLAYTSDHFPAQLNNETDVTEYSSYLTSPPGIVISNGTVCRIVDIQPGATSPMHRTVSLDYGVVLEGEIEILFPSPAPPEKHGMAAIQHSSNDRFQAARPVQNRANRCSGPIERSDLLRHFTAALQGGEFCVLVTMIQSGFLKRRRDKLPGGRGGFVSGIWT